MIACAVALLTLAGVITLARPSATTLGAAAYTSAPGVFSVMAYLPLAVGLLWLGRPPLPSRDWPMILDTIALSQAGSLLVWITVVRPTVTSLDLTGVEKVIATASWVGYVAVLAMSARVLLAWRTNLALALVGAGVVAFLVAEFFHGQALVYGPTPGSLAGLGFVAFGVLCGAAALTRSMAKVASAGHARHQLGPGRLTMLAAANLVAPTALLVQATSGTVRTGVAIAVVSAAVGVLMLVRLALSVRAYRCRAAREDAVRVASRALAVSITERDVVTGVDAALAAMLPAGAQCEVRLVDQGRRRDGGPTLSPRGRLLSLRATVAWAS